MHTNPPGSENRDLRIVEDDATAGLTVPNVQVKAQTGAQLASATEGSLLPGQGDASNSQASPMATARRLSDLPREPRESPECEIKNWI